MSHSCKPTNTIPEENDVVGQILKWVPFGVSIAIRRSNELLEAPREVEHDDVILDRVT